MSSAPERGVRRREVDAQIDDQARAFPLQSPAKNRVDSTARTVWLSPIFRWNGADFGEGTGAVRHVRWTEYDWSLNILRR